MKRAADRLKVIREALVESCGDVDCNQKTSSKWINCSMFAVPQFGCVQGFL